VGFMESKLQYSHFDRAQLSDVTFDKVDFTEASLFEAKLKRFEATESRFVKNNFFKTLLGGVDLSENEFLAPTLSMPPVELKDAIINRTQAADLISLWGVIVKE